MNEEAWSKRATNLGMENANGFFVINNNEVYLSPYISKEQVVISLLHEGLHSVQKKSNKNRIKKNKRLHIPVRKKIETATGIPNKQSVLKVMQKFQKQFPRYQEVSGEITSQLDAMVNGFYEKLDQEDYTDLSLEEMDKRLEALIQCSNFAEEVEMQISFPYAYNPQKIQEKYDTFVHIAGNYIGKERERFPVILDLLEESTALGLKAYPEMTKKLASVYTGSVEEMDPRLAEIGRYWYRTQNHPILDVQTAQKAYETFMHATDLSLAQQEIQKKLEGVESYLEDKGRLHEVLPKFYERIVGLL